MAESLKYTAHQYGSDNELQRLGVWELDPANESKYWIIYIHGGAWRDPRIDHLSFAQSITSILGGVAGVSTTKTIAGFASLDYRLSPHPEFPQDPASTPGTQLRTARHPDHVDDVRAGLTFLQSRYGFGSRYILFGHSAGACLALQILAGLHTAVADDSSSSSSPLILPEAVIPCEGIYDFTGIDARMGGTYAGFLSAAFGPPGPESKDWDAASPMRWSAADTAAAAGGSGYGARWPGGKVALLTWSRDDELVDEPEVDGMAERLRKDGVEGGRLAVWKDVKGKHDEIWEKGDEVARMVHWVLEKITG